MSARSLESKPGASRFQLVPPVLTRREPQLLLLGGLALALLIIARVAPESGEPRTQPWSGVVRLDQINVRAAATTRSPIVDVLRQGNEVTVLQWVEGEPVIGSNALWAQVGPERYVYTHGLHKATPMAPPPAPADAVQAGRWIDVNLTQQVATAYDNNRPAFWAVISAGRPGWATPTGVFRITRRVYNETMASGALASESYYIRNVLFTQYFTGAGHALHLNYWKWDSPFGVPTSHGCVGLDLEDARRFWEFAEVDTPVVIHD